MEVPELLTAREVAQRLHIGTRTVWRWCASGELPAPVRLGKAGRVVRWKAAEIEEYLRRALELPPGAPLSNGYNGASAPCGHA